MEIEYQHCFSSSYQSARERFIETAAKSGAIIESFINPMGLTPEGDPLSTDIAWFGAPCAKKVLLAICGTHGLEAPSGAATMMQWMLMEEYKSLPEDTAVLFVHANNPYGWAHSSRGNEDNVDVNRNYFDHSHSIKSNEAYLELENRILLREIDDDSLAEGVFGFHKFIEEWGASYALDAMVTGQYERPEGLIYGGRSLCWSNQTMDKILETKLSEAEEVLLIDWHTGLGCFGTPLVISIDNHPAIRDKAGELFGKQYLQEDSDYSGGQTPDYQGMVISYIHNYLAGQGKSCLALAIEFGTYKLDSVLQGLLIDNWLRTSCKDTSDIDALLIREKMIERFNPSMPDWRREVLIHSQRIYQQAMGYFQ